MTLNDWLADFQLNENPLLGPIFYKTPLALRFEIGPDAEIAQLSLTTYLEKVYQRAVYLLDRASSTYDYLLFSQYQDEDRELGRELADFMARFGFDQPIQSEVVEVLVEGESCYFNRHLFAVTQQDLENIVREIIWADHGGLSYLSASVTFLSSRDQVLYHCYDDRGVDIAAVNRQTRRALFTFCHDLLFDYDMEEMKRRMTDLD